MPESELSPDSGGQGGTMFSGRTPDGKSIFWYSGQ
jgi:hypothetical protein